MGSTIVEPTGRARELPLILLSQGYALDAESYPGVGLAPPAAYRLLVSQVTTAIWQRSLAAVVARPPAGAGRLTGLSSVASAGTGTPAW